ncbi:MAG: phage tail length tape measure family protein, partial [Gammaproteobacteria bacterium]
MATPAAAVLLDILVNTGSFETDTERARKALERFQKTAKQADPAVRDFSKGLKDAANSAAFLTGPLGGVSSRLNLIANAATAGKLAFFAWGAAAFASYEILKKTLTVGEEYEKNQLRTNAILKATGGTAGLTATEIHDLAVSLGESTLASVGGAEKAAQKLLTFRSVAGETFKEALRLSQDLSATGFGQLEQVVVQVGKALEDPIKGLTALKRVGVSFTETQKEMIENFLKTNDLVSAQGIILEALRTQVGGAGAAEGAGLAGAFDLLNQRVEEFFATIGEAGATKFLTDTLNILSGAINSVNKAVEDSPQARLRDLINLYGQLETEGAAPEQLAAINNEIQKLQVVLGTLGQAQDNARQKAEDYQNSLKTERIEEYIKSQRVLKKSIEEVADAAKIQALKDLGGNAQQIAELQQVLNQNRFDKAQLDAAREARAEAKRAAKEAIRDAERLVEKRQAIVDKLREEVATFGQT